MNNRTFIVIAIVLALTTASWFSMFEHKTVPDINWQGNYNYNGKDALDLWLFNSLLKDDYNVVEGRDSLEVEPVKKTMIVVDNWVRFSYTEFENIMDDVSEGSTLLIVGNSINLNGDDIEHVYGDDITADSLALNIDSVEYFVGFESRHKGNKHFEQFQDLQFELIENNAILDVLLADFYTTNYIDTLFENKRKILRDTMMVCYQIDEGKICIHNAPYLFSNIAASQDFYLPHYKRILSTVANENIVLIKQGQKSSKAESPLKYILNQRSFRWAYYLAVLTVILYVIFGGKRKQAVIPLVNKKKNTSMEFVYTVSRLYKNQKRHDRLALKMKANFMNFVENKYFIYENDREFWEKLQKKSKAEENLLNMIKKELSMIYEHMDYSTKKLSNLYLIINKFYTHTKNK